MQERTVIVHEPAIVESVPVSTEGEVQARESSAFTLGIIITLGIAIIIGLTLWIVHPWAATPAVSTTTTTVTAPNADQSTATTGSSSTTTTSP